MGAKLSRIKENLKKLSGNVFNHQIGVFLIFLVISAVLWFVTALSEEVNRQITCSLQIVNVPDSVTFINEPPKNITVGVRIRGTQLMQRLFGAQPSVNIDFNSFGRDNRFSVTRSAMTEIAQSFLGDESQVQSVYPDSIGVYYTTLPPVYLPVRNEVSVTTVPNIHLVSPVLLVNDSVKVYTAKGLPENLRYISTKDVRINNVDKTCVVKVPLNVPPGTRAVPDSVSVRIVVEPYVTEIKTLPVEAINVPHGKVLQFNPQKVKASFRVPRSMRTKLPAVRIVADYNSIADDSVRSEKIAINTDPWISFIFLDTDSVEYFITNESPTPHYAQ